MKKNDFSSDDLTRYGGHYNEDDFWKKISAIARKAGIKTIYYALVLYETLADSATPVKYRAVIAGALGYLILPLDLIPDFLPAFGFADDWAALLAAVLYVIKAVTPEIKSRAKSRLSSWFSSVTEEDLGDLK
ncbi:MAG: DUF1232 domain-containing protein [Bacteroidales bacterium]|nr:DUF1232 domain-containing protein [Bacteroidales bacterium]MBO4585306.1 DUF1232 domain-containing protein [Bacteroidales bacterium]